MSEMRTRAKINADLAAAMKNVATLEAEAKSHGSRDVKAVLQWRYVPRFNTFVLVGVDPQGDEQFWVPIPP